VIYLSRRPAPPLDTAVSAVWYVRGVPRPFGFERVLPKGRAQLIVNLKEDRTRAYDERGGCVEARGAVLSGLGPRFEIIDTDEQEHVVGVVFTPGGTAGFFRDSAWAMRGRDVPLEALWGVTGTALLREALLEAATPAAALDVLECALINARLDRGTHPAVAFALARFHHEPDVARVGAVTRGIGMSPKRFTERFKAEVGLTPKQYCRLQRFQRAVAAAHADDAIDWSDVALACGYFDQAHFIHDFRAFSGLTPGAYRRGRTVFPNHVTFLQSLAS
jgi:AraC-like DNA-binding protein